MSDDGKATNELLDKLHGKIAEEFIARIASGEAKSADLSAAVKFLSDNGVRQMPGDDKAGLRDALSKLVPFKPKSVPLPEPGMVDTVN